MPIPPFAPTRQRSPMDDDLLAAARQRAHDRGPAPMSLPSPHHHAGDDAALHHRGAQGAGVEVHEALVHPSSGGQVRAEPDRSASPIRTPPGTT
jgi:hypothetical protein